MHRRAQARGALAADFLWRVWKRATMSYMQAHHVAASGFRVWTAITATAVVLALNVVLAQI